MIMRRLLPAALLGTLALTAGCHLLHRKKAAAPELPPAAGIEAEYRDRWVDRRVHDLMTSRPNLTEAEARQTAEAEFAKQYPYVSIPATAPVK
jgi:hypothetical protein